MRQVAAGRKRPPPRTIGGHWLLCANNLSGIGCFIPIPNSLKV